MEKQSRSFLTVIIMLSMASHTFSAASASGESRGLTRRQDVHDEFARPEIQQAREAMKAFTLTALFESTSGLTGPEYEKLQEAWARDFKAAKERLEKIDPQVFISSMEEALKDEVQRPGTKQGLIDRGAPLYATLQAKKSSYQCLSTEEKKFLSLYQELLEHKTVFVAAQDLLGHVSRMVTAAAAKPTAGEATKYVMGATAAYVTNRLTYYTQGLWGLVGFNGKKRIA